MLNNFMKLGMEKVVTTDFKDFVDGKNGVMEKKDLIDKMFNYYLENELNKKLPPEHQKETDCDSLKITKKIYKEVYQKYENENPKEIYGETLNSFHMLYKFFIQRFRFNSSSKYRLDDVIDDNNLFIDKKIRNKAFKEIKENYRVTGDGANKLVWYYVLRNFEAELNLPIELIHFGRLTHSIGNFMPVCCGFNVGRLKKTNDLWFIALDCIYWYYNTDKDEYLKRFLSNISVVEHTKEWLMGYGQWENFVNENYLQDFLQDPNDPNSNPKLFFGYSHDSDRFQYLNIKRYIKNGVKIVDVEDITEKAFLSYINSINKSIYKRGERIYNKIQNNRPTNN